jgi:hypothetical protein
VVGKTRGDGAVGRCTGKELMRERRPPTEKRKEAQPFYNFPYKYSGGGGRATANTSPALTYLLVLHRHRVHQIPLLIDRPLSLAPPLSMADITDPFASEYEFLARHTPPTFEPFSVGTGP